MLKAFKNTKHNGIHLVFPNGNWLSTIWGVGSYSDNYDIFSDDVVKDFSTFRESNNVEIMFTCGDRLKKKICKKYNEGSTDPIGYLDITQWLEIVNLLATEKSIEKKPGPSKTHE